MANDVLIREVTLNQTVATIVLDNIPQSGYTDLKLVVSARSNRSGARGYVQVTFNGATTNQTERYLYADGVSASSSTGTNNWSMIIPGASQTANTYSNVEVYIPNYLTSNPKSFSVESIQESNEGNAFPLMTAGLWTGTAAIFSISLFHNADNSASFVAGTTVSLYGIANINTTATVIPKASGGDIVVNDGTYWYHAFLSSGSFIPATALSCDTLIVAGGGSSGYNISGGGGAGGLLLDTSNNFTNSTNYVVTVGAGGTAVTGGAGGSGGNSSITGLTIAIGGGGGASYGTPTGPYTGGSGGGGSAVAGNITGASGTAGQGFAGGNGSGSSGEVAGGGGGGRTAIGGNGTSGTNATGGVGGAGAGGTGFTNYAILNAMASATQTGVLSSGNYYYAGGGGGGANNYLTSLRGGYGGIGGGGNGGGGNGLSQTGIAGTINTGGGAGGAGNNTQGSNGGSGIVIIRYAMA